MELADISGGDMRGDSYLFRILRFLSSKTKRSRKRKVPTGLYTSIFLSIMLHNNILCTYVDVYPCKFYYDK